MSMATEHHSELDLGLSWRNSFSALGEDFFTRVAPQPLASPYWVGSSRSMARELGLEESWLASAELLQALSGNRAIAGTQPLASVYSGHQFGVWAGQLGDGRAILLGETAAGLELQLKGAGLTPYSRMADGRAVLRSSIREFLCSEAMHGLGIPSTRALCVTGADVPVYREITETAAVLTRLAPSFVRFGHFEHFSSRAQLAQLKTLADYVIDRHYPGCRAVGKFAGNAYAALLEAVSERTAGMVARWQAAGFCHGVMNTDNMSILGLTIDYGPFQFLDGYRPGHVCNHSDNQGRYAFDRQPRIAYWNLFCLAQALMPLIEQQDLALQALESFKTVFPEQFGDRMRAKLGLLDTDAAAAAGDLALIEDLLQLLAGEQVDYTIFWRRLSHAVARGSAAPAQDLFLDRPRFELWWQRYEKRRSADHASLAAERMFSANPKFVLRNHLAEMAIQRARMKDFAMVASLLTVLESPFGEHPEHEEYAAFPPDWAQSIEISCSS
ncbi:MAG: protein adenylyltransferase SelO [Rhodoferax sp.]